MRIAMTGATSLLGRNLLFEIIKQNINDLDKLEIIVLGKEKNGKNLSRRIKLLNPFIILRLGKDGILM